MLRALREPEAVKSFTSLRGGQATAPKKRQQTKLCRDSYASLAATSITAYHKNWIRLSSESSIIRSSSP